MAESNATQVILTDDGIKIINAQNTADSAASQAENANSATLIAQSTANAAKSAADSTYDYASSEMAVHSMATAKAQSAADNAFSQAQTVFSQADSEIAVQSTATAKAQSTADNAFSQATAAIDNGKVTSQAVTDLKDGSKLTIADLENGLATKVANSDYASYKVQTASQIAQKVDNGAFSAYQQTTADLIAQKVATSDFSAYQATTAKAISSKVSSNDFNTYKTQTADLIDDKVSSSQYSSDKTQTASEIADRVSNSAFSTYQTQTASQIAQKVDNGTFSAYQTTTAGLIAQKVATSDFSTYQATTAKEISSKVESSDFQTYQTQTKDMIASKVSKSDANNANLIPYSSNFTTPLTGWTLMNWGATDRKLLVTTHTFYQNGTGALLYLNTAQNGTAAAGSNRFPLSPNTTYTFQFKAFASSNVVGANVYLLTRTYGSTNDYDIVHGLFTNLVTSPSHIDQYTVTFTTGANDNEGYIRVDNIGSNNSASSGLFFTELKLELGGVATPYVYGGQDSMISQMSDDINLRVTKDGLIDQINIQAGNTIISSSGQLTLSGKTIYFDTVNPVIIPSANITGTLTGKNINLDINGLINSPYTGIEQSADQYYHPWKLNTGQLTIGQGYITSVSSGTRSINGVPKQFNSLQGTLSASYLKFTNDYGARTYIDADMFTYSNQTNDTAMVAISAGGVGINMGTMSAPALTISNGYIDASSSSSYGKFGAITLGYNAHTINSDSSLFFESGYGSGNPGINIWAKGFQSLSSRLSTKRQVRLLDDEHSNSLLLGADTATFQYNQDTNADNSNEGVIIDDVNTVKQYNLPDELITRDGKAPTDLMSFIARVISQNKYQARLIEDLQIRLRKVEIKNE
ncbi:orf97 [Lactiplantibacillus plantarum]|nr:orf97 [Lactiplantibacillus plantarum]